MTDSDKSSGNQPNQWTAQDWRMLVITFVGGVASIIVGAALVGLAFALARIYTPHNDFPTWFFLVICPVFSAIGCVAVVTGLGTRSWFSKTYLGLCGSFVVYSILVWVGVAAGIH